MKQFLFLFLFLFLCAFISTSTSFNTYETQAVITLNRFPNLNLYSNLIEEFSRINGVSSCESSYTTKTIMVQFDGNKLNVSDIKKVLNKWECDFGTISFNTLIDYIE